MTTTNLTSSQIHHIAKLAKLTLTNEEVAKYGEQLSAILEYVDKLQEVETTGVEPTSQVTGLTDVFIKDGEAIPRTLSQQAALSNAKQTHNGYVVVPAVIDKS